MENLTVEAALEQLLSNTKVIQETETVSLLKSKGRILAEDIKAELDNPPFDRSPIDGYACTAEDLAGASLSTPDCLKVTREVDAGDYSEETVKKGEAVRIMTGAAVPAGCDCCVRQEDTDYHSGCDTLKPAWIPRDRGCGNHACRNFSLHDVHRRFPASCGIFRCF